jgi:putative SOS response-associated peptidase YedK
MSGYFEWQATAGGKQPWYFSARAGSPLLTAAGAVGRMERPRDWRATKVLHDDHHRAKRLVAEVHDRMPARLSEKQFAPWLSGEAGAEFLKPAPNDYLQRWPVSKRVNSSKADADDATLIDRIEPIRAV